MKIVCACAIVSRMLCPSPECPAAGWCGQAASDVLKGTVAHLGGREIYSILLLAL
jgi:hypothetical protein